jgi:hypothetical protein
MMIQKNLRKAAFDDHKPPHTPLEHGEEIYIAYANHFSFLYYYFIFIVKLSL